MNGLQELYKERGSEIKKRLDEFKNLSEEQKFKEFMFCLLTPQSNAQRCWQAVEEISRLSELTTENVTEILSKKTRFHHTKAKRILNARETWNKLKDKLSSENIIELRNFLAENVNGYGLKEASHFLRNTGLSNNKIAILDRHILRNLDEKKVTGWKNYLEIEKKFLNYAKQVNIPADELDLLWWSKENGEVFK